MVSAAIARERGFEVLALTVDYNQRHRIEIEAARRIASSLADRHVVLPLDLRAFGGSALTGDAAVPKGGVQPGIPITYVPAGTEGRDFTIHAPLQHMSKADIAREASRLGLDATLSHSCYDPQPDGTHCGLCDACRLRAKGFAEAEIADPTRYAEFPLPLAGEG